jgi:hypothetical protein
MCELSCAHDSDSAPKRAMRRARARNNHWLTVIWRVYAQVTGSRLHAKIVFADTENAPSKTLSNDLLYSRTICSRADPSRKEGLIRSVLHLVCLHLGYKSLHSCISHVRNTRSKTKNIWGPRTAKRNYSESLASEHRISVICITTANRLAKTFQELHACRSCNDLLFVSCSTYTI